MSKHRKSILKALYEEELAGRFSPDNPYTYGPTEEVAPTVELADPSIPAVMARPDRNLAFKPTPSDMITAPSISRLHPSSQQVTGSVVELGLEEYKQYKRKKAKKAKKAEKKQAARAAKIASKQKRASKQKKSKK